jgi:hypothetical protein
VNAYNRHKRCTGVEAESYDKITENSSKKQECHIQHATLIGLISYSTSA